MRVHKTMIRFYQDNSTMSSSRASREHGSLYLPQYGFGPTLDFADLVGSNQFLFRVHTPKERSPFFDDTEPFFIAPKFDERYRNITPGGLKDWELDDRTAIANATYQDVARHMTWTTRSSSPYISTSFNPIWSIWEAVRRYHHGVKQDVEIAIIDAHAVSDRAITAVSLLSKASSREYVFQTSLRLSLLLRTFQTPRITLEVVSLLARVTSSPHPWYYSWHGYSCIHTAYQSTWKTTVLLSQPMRER